MSDFKTRYIPILSISSSEIKALSELPEKDKDLILPYFPLKGWMGSNKLENTIKKINEIYKDRAWIADIDYEFIRNSSVIKKLLVDGKYPREVYDQVLNLSQPNNGYANWIEYCSSLKNVIPTIQLDDISELEAQCLHYSEPKMSEKPVALRIRLNNYKNTEIENILKVVSSTLVNPLYILIDLGQINHAYINNVSLILKFVKYFINATSNKKNCTYSLSATSFPSSFSGMSEGESSVYERILFDKISNSIETNLIYSDYGSVSLNKATGASRIPPPRIDYPRKLEWKHVRKDFEDVKTATKEEKHKIYTSLAKKIIEKEYWDPNLLVWGTQQIQKTAIGDSFGITDAQKATATRINIHLFQQLHYSEDIENIDTDDDWVD
ncbi:MAG: beta family protein [Mycoplasmatales bacterium]